MDKQQLQQQRYYRTIVTIEILSDRPIPSDTNLDSIRYDITEGDCSGLVDIHPSEEVSPEKMASLLRKQGSDPSFLLGEEESNY